MLSKAYSDIVVEIKFQKNYTKKRPAIDFHYLTLCIYKTHRLTQKCIVKHFLRGHIFRPQKEKVRQNTGYFGSPGERDRQHKNSLTSPPTYSLTSRQHTCEGVCVFERDSQQDQSS